MANIKLRHVSGKIVTVDKKLAEKMMQRNPGKYEEVKKDKPKKETESKD